MIEKTIYDYLNDVASVDAYMERPETKPASYLLIEKTGSRVENQIETSTIAVQSYAPTLFKAAELNEEVKGLMKELPYADNSVSAVKLNSDYNFTNVADKQYRYQAIFVVTHY